MARFADDRARWLARFVLPHEPALRRWLEYKNIVGLDVDDIVQEAYAIMAALENVDNIRNAKNYIYQVAYSIIASHIRRSHIVSLRVVANLDALNVTSDEPNPEQWAADREELHRLGEALAVLPARVREVFILRRIEGLTQRQIAERLAISENTVEKHIGRGIHLLMDIFGRGGKSGRHASIDEEDPIRGDPIDSARPDRKS